MYDENNTLCDSEMNLLKSEFKDLIVTKIAIKIETYTETFEYTGQPQYHDKYEIISGSLLDGHELNFEDWATITMVGSTSNTVTVYVIDEEENVLSQFYDVSIEITGTLYMLGGKITVTTKSKIFTYNGEEQTYEVYEITSGDNLLVDLSHEVNNSLPIACIENVGVVTNEFSIRIYSGNDDLTDQFDIDYINGTLTVIPKEITVSIEDNYVTYEYNGFEQSVDKNDVVVTDTNGSNKGSIDDNSFIVINSTLCFAPQTTSLFFEIEFDGIINDNYTIKYAIDGAKIIITKRNITLDIKNVLSEFNGEEQTNTTSSAYSVFSGSFASNEESKFSFNSISQKDINYRNDSFVDNDDNYIISFTNLSIEGLDDIYNYYNILFTDNTAYIMITPITVTITAASDEKEYDGFELSNDNYEIKGNILEGHDFKVEVTGSITNVGEETNRCNLISYNAGIYQNDDIYDIKIVHGNLIVHKIKLEYNLYSITKAYSQTSSYIVNTEDYAYYKVIGNLPSGYTTEIDVREVCDNYSGIMQVTEVRIFNNGQIVDNTNFDIQHDDIIINYTAVNLTITAASATKAYDGEALTAKTATITNGYLLEGHRFEVVITTTRTAVGSTINRISSYTIYDGDTELTDSQLTMYYKVVKGTGTLLIT